MKNYIRLILLFNFILCYRDGDAQVGKQEVKPVSDSLIKEVKSLLEYESGFAIVLGGLENYEWNVRSAYWDSIYESKGGTIIRYPDSPNVKKLYCDSISPHEKIVFSKLIDIKKRTTDDILINLSNNSTPEVAVYCFMLLCSDDNPKSKAILDHYLYSDTKIWVEKCGQRKEQKVRDYMLNRLLLCMFYDGRVPMITEEELKKYYLKIGQDYPFKTN